jgi:GDP-L-fucose synthase
MQQHQKIYVAGHTGMVGSALVRKLQALGYTNIVTRSSAELDLRNQAAVQAFFKEEQPAFVFMAAAKVGGIHANNTFRADFIYDNLMMEANVIHAAFQYQVEKLLFLGSSCIYPKLAPQPLKEDYLLAGQLESTNEPYAIAKIAGIKLCEAYRAQYACNFISAMPTNLYGPNDNYDLQNAHVLPALIRKFHEAKVQQAPEVVLWGTGKPMREFMHVDDLAAACCFLMQAYNEAEFVNIGTGVDITIAALAQLIKEIVGYEGELINDITKPDGTPRKLMDVSKMTALGWSAQIDLESGIRSVYEAYKSTH